MSGMNQFLAEYFGTSAPDNDEIQKQAQVEMFLKLAEEEGIDIDQLSDEQVEELYASTFGEEGEEGDDGEEASEKEASEKEAADKFAEAEFMGRTMAHAYVDELNKIASAGTRLRGAADSVVGAARNVGRKYMDTVTGKGTAKAKSLVGKAQARLNAAGKGSGAADALTREARRGSLSGAKSKLLKARGVRAAAIAPLALGAAGTATALPAGIAGRRGKAKGEEKKAEFDIYAGNLAVEKLAHAGFNTDEAIDRLNAVITLDDGENTKVAFARSSEEAVEIRSLELAELAGYPVDWA